MVKFLTAIANAIDTLNEYVGRSVAWLTLLLVLLVCYDVANRSIFNSTKTWIMELEWHLFSLIFILGAGYALKHNKHVRVDLFFAKFSRRDQAWTNLIGAVVFLILGWLTFSFSPAAMTEPVSTIALKARNAVRGGRDLQSIM